MSDVTHAYCKQCTSYRPILWNHITVAQPFSDMSGCVEFRGMECKCESCGFKIAELGQLSQKQWP